MRIFKSLISALVLGVLLVSCAPVDAPVVNTEYILTTDMRDGKFVFVGVNEDINGTVNPSLHAKPGEKISVMLINGGYGEHDIVFPELNIHSDVIHQKGETTKITFSVPEQDVVLTYQDSSHAKLGMSGVLLVGAVIASQPDSSESTQDAMGMDTQAAGKTVEYTLESALADGKMIYIGKGSDLDGKTNPDLTANPGDLVRVTLFSGEGATHNIFFDGFNAKSEDVAGKGNSVVVEFTPDKEGTFAYYCTILGHRLAGMQGKFIVGSGTPVPGCLRILPWKQDRQIPTPWTLFVTQQTFPPRLGSGDLKPYALIWKPLK